MKKHILCFIAFTLFTLIISANIFAQLKERTIVHDIIKKYNDLEKSQPQESVYIHTDRTGYSIGDTLWFKAYLFNKSLLTATSQSGILYLELVDKQNKVSQKTMLRINEGTGSGYVVLNANELKEGDYLLRAYSNYMFNFQEPKIFNRRIYIFDKQPPVFFNIRYRKMPADSLGFELKLSDVDGAPVLLHNFSLRVLQGREVLFRKNVKTTMDASVDVRFARAKRDTGSTLVISKTNSTDSARYKNISFSIPLNRPQKTDVQFFPEGGYLVAGKRAVIAVKTLAENGLGVPFSGTVFNSKNAPVVSFQSVHRGMGKFALEPQVGEKYLAKVTFTDGSVKTVALPAVKDIGTTMMVSSQIDSMVTVKLSATKLLTGRYLFIAQSSGRICYASIIKLTDSISTIRLPTRFFSTGIARLTLFDANRKPLNERALFIQHPDNLTIKATTDKKSYGKRDSVSVLIDVKDASGTPVQGTFSMAVTDKSQVRSDTSNTIESEHYLASELRGNIENPAYYFTDTNSIKNNLDLLLLTQGFTQYPWERVFNAQKKFIYPPEKEFEVKGHVSNLFNKPVANSKITLFSTRPFVLKETMTNTSGDFLFNQFPAIDTAAAFFLQAYNKHGKANNVGIDIRNTLLPVLENPLKNGYPWFVNTSENLINEMKNLYVQKEASVTGNPGNRLLTEVKITAKKIVKGSKNLNGAGNTDQVLDEADMQKAARKTLEQLLTEKVKGFRTGTMPRSAMQSFMLRDKVVRFIIDGIDVDFFYSPFTGALNERYLYHRSYLDYYVAEDIKGIEIMYSASYAMKYAREFLGPMADPFNVAFIEITTRGGKGPFVKHTPGTFQYKSIPFAQSKLFYKPRYVVRSAAKQNVDSRPTIHWEPNIISDKQGQARVWFYTSDQAGLYNMIIEGSDMRGSLGWLRENILVK